MKKNYLFLVFSILSVCSAVVSKAQIVGAGITAVAYLQGAFVEIGVQPNASFGAPTPPATYHPFPAGPLAMVYDQGHDGWAVGTPPYRGDYTYPGSPFEGWSVQMNGGVIQGFQGFGTGYNPTAGFTVTGSGLTTYSNVGGVVLVNWAGTLNNGGGTLNMRLETRVDTLASSVVMTAYFYNPSPTTPVNGVYFLRSCDPDNDEARGGAAYFFTTNFIKHQNEDASHRVDVEARGGFYPADSTEMDLCAKDCRAKGFIYSSWPPSNTVPLSTMWAGTATLGATQYGLYDSLHGDIAVGIVFNIGTIRPLDSASVSCSYVFNKTAGIDSNGTYPEPALEVAGLVYTTPGFPVPIIDTYNACANPGLTLVPVSLLHADVKNWSLSTWTWAPSIGLAATTGLVNNITTTVLPPVITYTITGTDSATCSFRTIYLTLLTCNNVRANSPCEGDTLFLKRVGDSTGCTYYWYGPGGYTSTRQNPFIFPATMANAGEFYVVRTLAGAHDTDSINVVIHPKPVITAGSNAPLCRGMIDTLLLTSTPASPGDVFNWTGPTSSHYTATGQNVSLPGYTTADTGIYRVIVTTTFGCKDTAYTDAGTIRQPDPPIVTNRRYCQGDAFQPYTISGVDTGGYVLWYTSGTGGVGDTIPTNINTAFPQNTKVYFSQKKGSCESNRDSITVRVVTKPTPPIVSGTTQYCQYIGPIIPLSISPATADTISWYIVSTGGTAVYVAPVPDINTAGTYPYYVSQTDTGCESDRTAVTIIVHPKPAPPIVTPTPLCQFLTPGPLVATASGSGDFLLWYGPGTTPGSTIAPTYSSSVAPDTTNYYVTETTIYGCVSDSALDAEIIWAKPQPPTAVYTRYCQHDYTTPLRLLVDSLGDSHLNWYYNTIPLGHNPYPFTDTIPATYTWYVSQTVPNAPNGCQSDSIAVSVTIIYKPEFGINVSAPYVCRGDSLTLSYCCGPQLDAPAYLWTLPSGANAVAGTGIHDSSIRVQFNNAADSNFVTLRVSDDSGFCYTDVTKFINVIAQPAILGYTNPEVCIGDTTELALSGRTPGAHDYAWYIDSVLLRSSGAINLISYSSNSGGPYLISWLDSGQHVIMVTSVTSEGCRSQPAYDSIKVHGLPNASFTYSIPLQDSIFCLEDSALFYATANNYGYSYQWTPVRYFNSINKPVIYGKMSDEHSVVTLTVTDAYGCKATSSQELNPGTCCNVVFPNAFTPNGSGKNDVFRPIFAPNSYHRFHTFRIANRWGQTVFDGGNSTVVWDGNYNGVPQDMGVYFYYIKFDCGGKTIEQRGDITLIR